MSRLLVWVLNVEVCTFPVAVNSAFTVTVFSLPLAKSKPLTVPPNVAEPRPAMVSCSAGPQHSNTASDPSGSDTNGSVQLFSIKQIA